VSNSQELALADVAPTWCIRPPAECFRALRPSGRAARTA
jgi:hypothetical protein